jgi:hypothetical protein
MIAYLHVERFIDVDQYTFYVAALSYFLLLNCFEYSAYSYLPNICEKLLLNSQCITLAICMNVTILEVSIIVKLWM